PLGRQLSKLPVDPRIGRMLHAASENNCLSEILIIASALESQDPRIRPVEKQKAADEQHAKFRNEKSDFMSFLSLWDFSKQLKDDLSKSKFRKACQQNFLSVNHLFQWQEIHRQLKTMVRQQGWKPNSRKDEFNAIHRSLLTGLLSGIGMLTDKHEYTGSGGKKFNLWPGSGVFGGKPKWIVASEIVETSKRYGRTIAKIAPEWLEPLAKHLAKSNLVDPHWSKKRQTVMAYENVSLFGLPIVLRRRIGYGKTDVALSRQLFIEQGLVEFEISHHFKFLEYNRQKLQEVEQLAAKSRDAGFVIDTYLLAKFYDETVPENCYDVATLKSAIAKNGELDELLRLQNCDLGIGRVEVSQDSFPVSVLVGSMNLTVDYKYEPGFSADGATISIP
ncbi:MAG: DUF3418 domain-containing protein, partial [Planctomycetota bacterium]